MTRDNKPTKKELQDGFSKGVQKGLVIQKARYTEKQQRGIWKALLLIGPKIATFIRKGLKK